MMSSGVNPSFVDYSLAANCMDTAKMVANEMQVGRNRIVPEYTLLDPRAVGLWDGNVLSETLPAVWALDVDEAGSEGRVSQISGTEPARRNVEFCRLLIANLSMSRVSLPSERTDPI